MGWLDKVISAGTGSFMDKASIAIKRFVTTEGDRNKIMLELEGLLQERDSEIEQTIRAELSAKERVLVAELQQSDGYTKRARPTVVYAGLVFIAINYVIVPIIGRLMPDVSAEPLLLPTQFWVAWGGICATWVIGRSAEKRGIRNKAVGVITGNAPISSLLESR
jgi:Holin of 3TMs, for gene-transfer release